MPKRVVPKQVLKEEQLAAAQAGRNPRNVSGILYAKRRYAEDEAYRERVKARNRAYMARRADDPQ